VIPVYVLCAVCLAAGGWVRCSACDGLHRQWAPGAPTYGCEMTLADREPGEVVTLGNGQRAKILWHMPRKRRGSVPETTFLDILVEFYETETLIPVPYPSCIGVASVDVRRAVIDREAHEREVDAGDPLQRHAGALL
jgi:hypothetical protein